MSPPSRFIASIVLLSLWFVHLDEAISQDLKPLMKSRLQGQAAVSFDPTPHEEIGIATDLSNKVFKPTGAGPFSAVVLIHSCGGMQQPQMRLHAKEFLEAGFVVLVQDSNGPRGKTSTCVDRSILSTVGAMDAFAGLAHLAAQPFVEKSRIFLVGYSWGGLVAQLAASPQAAEVFGASLRFRAVVSNYANCDSGTFPRLAADIDYPLLMLMGGADTETPSATCFPLLENMKAAGRPVEWHVYPGATHAWDNRQPGSGYKYDASVTSDASQRTLLFLKAQQ